MKKIRFICLVLLYLPTISVASSVCSIRMNEEVINIKTIESGIKAVDCDKRSDIDLALNVVKSFWSDPDKFELVISKEYLDFTRTRNIEFKNKYRVIYQPERIWVKQKYLESTKFHDNIRVTLLSAWTQEGYEGDITFIFELVKVDGIWKISNIIF